MENMLTGRTRYRAGFRGRLVLQVQYLEPFVTVPNAFLPRWRDARVQDLAVLQNVAVEQAREAATVAASVKH